MTERRKVTRPGRNGDSIQVRVPGIGQIDIVGQSIQILQVALLAVIAYAVLWIIGPQISRYADVLREMTVALTIQTCTSAERDPEKAAQRYEYCKRGSGR